MIVICCEELREEIANDTVLCILDNKPFTEIPAKSILYLMSDGGHGGLAETHFLSILWKGNREGKINH